MGAAARPDRPAMTGIAEFAEYIGVGSQPIADILGVGSQPVAKPGDPPRVEVNHVRKRFGVVLPTFLWSRDSSVLSCMT